MRQRQGRGRQLPKPQTAAAVEHRYRGARGIYARGVSFCRVSGVLVGPPRDWCALSQNTGHGSPRLRYAGITRNLTQTPPQRGARPAFGGGIRAQPAACRDGYKPRSAASEELHDADEVAQQRHAENHVERALREGAPEAPDLDEHGGDAAAGSLVEPVASAATAPEPYPAGRATGAAPTRRPRGRTTWNGSVTETRLETSRSACDGEVLDDDRGQRPAQPAARDLRARRRGLRDVLPPRLSAMVTSVAARPHLQDRGPAPEGLMREPTGDGVARHAFRTVFAAPPIVIEDAALNHRPIRVEILPDGFETELIKAENVVRQGAATVALSTSRSSGGECRNFHPWGLDTYPAAARTRPTSSISKSRYLPVGHGFSVGMICADDASRSCWSCILSHGRTAGQLRHRGGRPRK